MEFFPRDQVEEGCCIEFGIVFVIASLVKNWNDENEPILWVTRAKYNGKNEICFRTSSRNSFFAKCHSQELARKILNSLLPRVKIHDKEIQRFLRVEWPFQLQQIKRTLLFNPCIPIMYDERFTQIQSKQKQKTFEFLEPLSAHESRTATMKNTMRLPHYFFTHVSSRREILMSRSFTGVVKLNGTAAVAQVVNSI